MEESFIKNCDATVAEKEPAKDNHDADEEEKKSITEESAAVAEMLEDTATKPDSLSHNEKWQWYVVTC